VVLPERPPTRSHRLLAPVVALAVLVVIGLVALTISLRVTHIDATSLASFTPPSAASPTPTPVPLTDLARADLARVVTIEAERSSDEVLGTGWLFDAKGDFVTNAHVIDGQLTIRIRDRLAHTHVGRVVGVDVASDVALIRSADGFPGAALPVDQSGVTGAPFPVVAMASGRATSQPELTLETLTAVGQDVPIDSTDLQHGTGAPTTYHDMLQLDGARIYQGNSGGPVLDSRGKVIGIVTLASKSQTQAFAIPISRVFAELESYASKPD
jgi:serine protease Do